MTVNIIIAIIVAIIALKFIPEHIHNKVYKSVTIGILVLFLIVAGYNLFQRLFHGTTIFDQHIEIKKHVLYSRDKPFTDEGKPRISVGFNRRYIEIETAALGTKVHPSSGTLMYDVDTSWYQCFTLAVSFIKTGKTYRVKKNIDPGESVNFPSPPDMGMVFYFSGNSDDNLVLKVESKGRTIDYNLPANDYFKLNREVGRKVTVINNGAKRFLVKCSYN